MVMVSGPDVVQNLLVKGIASKKPEELYTVFEEIMNGVLTTRDVKKWASLRKPLDKMMERKWVDIWIDIFNKNADSFCEAIDDDTQQLNLPLRTFEYSVTNVLETHLGLPHAENFVHLWPTLLECLEKFGEISMRRISDITIRPDILFKMSGYHSEFMEMKQRFFAAFDQLLDSRKAHLKENNLDLNEEGCYTDFMMLRAKQLNYDKEETFKVGLDFIGAAAHSTTFTFASAILFLAMHPEYQNKLYEEIRIVFGESTGAPTQEQLSRLQYVDMVIKETLRHGGVPGVGRNLEQDLEIDGYIIPKNSILLFNQMLLSYNPKYWERPKDFYPEHFTPESEAVRPKGAFLPFSLGARSCPGKLYTMISMKVALSKAVQQFEFSTHLRFEDVEFNFGFFRTPSVFDVVAKRRTPLIK